ncbi:hypothetical protein [Pseudomonas trivialis]|uniref:hypothetical protein n=1 Tax=Pseudomonas trivialis TaxID=200450 RepID=UPI001112FB61|nr:hypothetical protein [Pseudomonas trivialis]
MNSEEYIMAIGGVGSNPMNALSGISGGLSAQAADAGIEAAAGKRRADGVKNAWKFTENMNTSGLKAAADAIRL